MSTKQVTDRLENLPGKLVRMGHLHESGRLAAGFRRLFLAEVKARFRFYPVVVMPLEFAEWTANNRTVLRVTRSVQDLTEDDEAMILDIDNGDWNAWAFSLIGASVLYAAHAMEIPPQLSIAC